MQKPDELARPGVNRLAECDGTAELVPFVDHG